MKWRVLLKYRYLEMYFDYNDLDEAGKFAVDALTHYSGNDDEQGVKVLVSINAVQEEEEEEKE